MANNRMWLVYKPTGRAVLIGKRMGFGWYTQGMDAEKFNAFFDECEDVADYSRGIDQDDFIMVQEIGNKFTYDKDEQGRIIIRFEKEESEE